MRFRAAVDLPLDAVLGGRLPLDTALHAAQTCLEDDANLLRAVLQQADGPQSSLPYGDQHDDRYQRHTPRAGPDPRRGAVATA